MRPPKHTFNREHTGWLLTFADMVTLMLALFVLIFSMSSVDNAVLQDISSGLDNQERRSQAKSGRIPENIRLAAAMLIDKENLRQQENRVKDLLFPQELLPPELDKGTVAQYIHIFEHKDGLLFTLDNALLFMTESSELKPGGRAVLAALADLMRIMPGEVNISGHEDPPGAALASGRDPYLASARHALAALGVFLRRDENPARFSLSAYGPDHQAAMPGTDLYTVDMAAPPRDARLEILLKNPS